MNWTLEQAEQKIENLLSINQAINKENKILDKTVANLCCCGNCDSYSKGIKCVINHLSYSYCDKWQSDGMTRQERLIA